MTEQAFLRDALRAIQAQQSIIEECSSNIARAMQEDADAFRELRSSISILNEMVRSVQAIARVAEPDSQPVVKKQKRRVVVEIPISRSSAARMGRDEITPSPSSQQAAQATSALGSGAGSGSSSAAASAAMGQVSRRSQTPIVRARKERMAVDLGFERHLYPPSYYATQLPLYDPTDTADLASDVESLPPSSLGEHDLEILNPETVEAEAEGPVELVRGREDLLAPAVLPESNREKSSVKWPKKGPNTHKGRMVSCDMCEAVFHWACGGFEESDDLGDKSWSCPECEDKVKKRRHRDIETAQKERCNRPDCIMRAYKSIRRPADDDEFIFDRIIGRKMVKRDNKAHRIYAYLILWSNYEIHDCTWEAAKSIPSIAQYEAEFLEACEQHGLNTNGTVLLPEATRVWNEDGLRRRRMLVDEGIVPGVWWEGDDEVES